MKNRIATAIFLTAVTVFFIIVKMPTKTEEHHINIIPYDKTEDVFGADPMTAFVPGYYESVYIYDAEIPLTATEQATIQDICDEYGVCYELVLAIIEAESSYQRDAINASGTCHGLMQINTHFHECGDPYEVEANVRAGVRYLANLFGENEDPGLVLDIYHGDSKAYERYEQGRLSSYAKRILERSEELERKHGK